MSFENNSPSILRASPKRQNPKSGIVANFHLYDPLNRRVFVNIVNEGTFSGGNDIQDSWHGCQEDTRRVLSSHITADQDERPHSRGLQGLAFQRPISDSLVLC